MLENDYLNTVNYNFYFWCKYCYLKPDLFGNYTYLFIVLTIYKIFQTSIWVKFRPRSCGMAPN